MNGHNNLSFNIYTLLVVLALGLFGCSKRNLQPLNEASSSVMAYGTVNANFCTNPPAPAAENVKYIFILDHSASNQPGFPLVTGDVSNTDPMGSRRYGPMINFIQNLTPEPNMTTSFALIDFNDTAYQPGTLIGFDSNASTFISTAQTDWIGNGTASAPSPYDKGFTNYQSALQMALQLIQSDLQSQAVLAQTPVVQDQYHIIFVSDGVPTVSTTSGGTYTQTFSGDIEPVISSIMNLKSNPTFGPYISSITLSTAYYYNDVQLPNAEALLQQMAQAGNGQYLQFAAGQNILYQQFAPPVTNIQNKLMDVLVQNENGVWWSNGQFMQSTAGDGLPDAIKEQMGANPMLKDSDGNGVSDFVEYLLNGKPCQDPNCSHAGANPYSVCAGIPHTTDANGDIHYISSSNDGLNDCEKYLLDANASTFNTNGDLIPDLFALEQGLPITPGTSWQAFADPFGDGITNYDKIKLGLPLSVSDKSLIGFKQRQTTLVPVPSSNPDESCYRLTVNNVALAALNNTIRVIVVQDSSAGQSKPFMTSAAKQMDPSSLSVSFAPGDFN